ncbi:3-hydroxy-9,10-secoandrosta-1,3,5(10)-triene-9,17-dione monooxygenase oxygenase subunit [Saccharomonospora iraqiensis]|uniref:3-hydroxy-9,10-secoandrosta-1,3,5(10)-triene-9, 17-dione monooxygenase oxygenase subunit n=1 Tax=Saccharomonospora iraqiensis TaxID=52698 RepID=UPI00022E1CCA|nr:3-hydroxy-9,10-secoandrosta-1,3,5(10)-triene-9,17-dione monooxygenase oxygenase subunit [Saccharomonospora iraqiensis]
MSDSSRIPETTPPTAEDVSAAVRALLPELAERASTCDERGSLGGETMAALVATGVLRLLQPTRYGGLEADPRYFADAVREIAGACVSTGWVTAVLGVHPWQLGLFDDRAQHEVWGDDPDVLICSSYAPVGTLTPVDGGYRLSGRWRFASGCGYASWAVLGAMAVDGTGRPVDFLSLLVPHTDYDIVPVWDVVGLRGTASDDLVVEDVFVPAHRVIRNYEQAQLRGPGQRVNPGPLYRMPFATVFTTAVTSPLVGGAAGCYEHYLTTMRDRVRRSLGGGRFAEDGFVQAAVARAASELDAAALQLDRNLGEVYAHARDDEPIPLRTRLRARRDQVRAAERAVEAIDLLFRTAGGSSLGRGNRVERTWRDVHAGSVHVANDVERGLALFGRGEFGLPVEDNLV